MEETLSFNLKRSELMKIAIILNGISRNKNHFYGDILPDLRQAFEVLVFETDHAHHAIELGKKMAIDGFDFVLAAGGDGTLNQVLNGVISQAQFIDKLPAIGIIPLGTGNDFARLCKIEPDAKQLLELLKQNNPKPTDIGKIVCLNEQGASVTHYFINVCSVGMGPEVVKRLLKSDRSLGPLLTYFKAITATFFTHHPQEICIKTPDWSWNGKARVFAVANGKSFGNAMYIAPDASPDDGIFSTFLAGELPLLKFLFFLQRIKGKKKISDANVAYNTCSMVVINSTEICPVEAEGELMGVAPAKIELIPNRIRFLR